MLKPSQFHKISLTLNLDRIITTTRQNTDSPSVLSQSKGPPYELSVISPILQLARWDGWVSYRKLYRANTCWDPHAALSCAILLTSTLCSFLWLHFFNMSKQCTSWGVCTWSVPCMLDLERVFYTLRLGKGTVWIYSPSLFPPPKKGFLWLRFKGSWKGKLQRS